VWVGAAPTGKKPAAVLKRKPSVDEVSMPKAKKAKGGHAVARKYLDHCCQWQNLDVCAAPSSQVKIIAPNKLTSRSKGSLINLIKHHRDLYAKFGHALTLPT
jgi:hypothetical protein